MLILDPYCGGLWREMEVLCISIGCFGYVCLVDSGEVLNSQEWHSLCMNPSDWYWMSDLYRTASDTGLR